VREALKRLPKFSLSCVGHFNYEYSIQPKLIEKNMATCYPGRVDNTDIKMNIKSQAKNTYQKSGNDGQTS
jgi:hypothetical protein